MDTNSIVWHQHTITKKKRTVRLKQKPVILWFTGLSCSGKSTLANALEEKLFTMGYQTYLLDGDNIRHGLCVDLGFSDQDRKENIRRIGEVSRLMLDAGLIVLTAFISPFERDRNRVRQLVAKDEFIEVYISTPLSVCEQRDSKGHYKMSRSGEIKNFTGIDSDYQVPVNPEITLDTQQQSITESVEKILVYLQKMNVIDN